MMKNGTRQFGRLVLSLGILACAPVLAQTEPPVPAPQDEPKVDFGGALYLDTRYVYNANRTSVSDNRVDETQVEYGANLFGSIEREKIQLAADYDFYQTHYLEDTQDDRFIRTGRSSLVLGNEKTFYQLDLGHSTQRFLVDPSGPTILSNTDQRDITSATPLLRLRPSRSTSIGVLGHYADIRYKNTDINDSERTGFGVQLQRNMSPVHVLGLNALQNEVDYKFGDDADYTYRRAGITFEGDLRLLEYSLEVGGNEAEPNVGEPVDGIYYDFAVRHGRYGNSWTFTAQQNITDTSMGNANDPFFSEGITVDVSTFIQDQIERRSFGLFWRSDFLCGLCDTSVGLGYEEENYVNVSTEDQTESFARGSIGYLLRPEAEIEFVLDHRRRDFAEGGRYDDYVETSAIVALSLDPIFRHFSMRFWFELDDRRPDEGSSYNTGAVGTTVAYNF